jgi:hypothetical protein
MSETAQGDTWSKSLAQSVCSALIKEAIAPPVLNWLGLSTGKSLSTYFEEVNNRLDRMGNDIGELKHKLNQVHGQLGEIKNDLKTGFNDMMGLSPSPTRQRPFIYMDRNMRWFTPV